MPNNLVLVPHPTSAALFAGTEDSQLDAFQAVIQDRISGAAILYNVYDQRPNGELVFMGHLETGEDGLKASQFGQEGLHFNHRR